MTSAVLEKPVAKEFALSVDAHSYLTISFMGTNLKLPIDNKTIGEIHDSSQSFLNELLEIPGVAEVFEKHGAIIEKL